MGQKLGNGNHVAIFHSTDREGTRRFAALDGGAKRRRACGNTSTVSGDAERLGVHMHRLRRVGIDHYVPGVGVADAGSPMCWPTASFRNIPRPLRQLTL